jgi:predicted RNase H-like HicB family nuclease
VKRKYSATIEKRGRWYVGYIDEVPGANTQGRTIKEVQGNLEEALRLVLESQKELAATEPPERTIKRAITVEV